MQLYSGVLEYVALSDGGLVTSVDVATKTVVTDFDKFTPAVANIIPQQKAGRIAEIAGVADRTGWCPIDPVTFESRLQPNIHVIGDAAIGGAMPRSASAANLAGKNLCRRNCDAACRRHAANADFDEYVLQLDRAGLRNFPERQLSSRRRHL